MGLPRLELRSTFKVGKFTFVKKKKESRITESLGYSEVYKAVKKKKIWTKLLLISCKEYNRKFSNYLIDEPEKLAIYWPCPQNS